ncbi:MAG: amidase, partial [Synechococcus sp.]|nr:amidase [Synechococcus sp.]
MWNARRRMNLPLPVTRKRLAAARRVLSFGMSDALRTNNQVTGRTSLSPSFSFIPWIGLTLPLVL